MLRSGVDVCNRCLSNQTPLHTSAELYHLSCMRALLADADADVNECDNAGCTPLCVACALGHAECAEVLLCNFADANHFDARGVPVLFTACAACLAREHNGDR